MRKRVFAAVIVAMSLLTMTQKSSAQLFLMDDRGSNNRQGSGSEGINLVVPLHGVNNDQFNTTNSEGSWGGFGNSSIDDNGNGNGSWGNFNMEDPYAPIGEGIVLLALSGLGYAALKRKKSKADSDSVLDRL